MNFFPTNSRDRWLLLLFPFKAYVFLAPAFFAVWNHATYGNRFRTDYSAAAGVIALGYFGCVLAFACACIILFLIKWQKDAFTAVFFAFLSFIISLLYLPMSAQS